MSPRERGMLFSAPMVLKLLSGEKTQTRRLVKHSEPYPDSRSWPFMHPARDGLPIFLSADSPELALRYEHGKPCPHGAPGDLLYVRETWGVDHDDNVSKHHDPARVCFKADGRAKAFYREYQLWRPSIHMPKWAVRIWLEITEVRVERLQSISEADARAEGAEAIGITFQVGREGIVPSLGGPYRDGFRILWSQINGPESWDANPWVWVLSFRRVEKGVGDV